MILERKEEEGERERERERNIDGREKHWLVASHVHPDQELNLQTFGVQMMLQPTEPPSQGKSPY